MHGQQNIKKEIKPTFKHAIIKTCPSTYTKCLKWAHNVKTFPSLRFIPEITQHISYNTTYRGLKPCPMNTTHLGLCLFPHKIRVVLFLNSLYLYLSLSVSHTHTYTHTPAPHPQTHTHTHSNTPTHSRAHTHTNPHTQTHPHTYTHALCYTNYKFMLSLTK
jgi:hypothetical protein